MGTAGSIVSNYMWGDAPTLSGKAIGGRDTFKDTATQTVGTQNSVEDFSLKQHDHIVFSGVVGVASFANLTFYDHPREDRHSCRS